MTYIPLKKDLTEETEICHNCNRKLKSLKAYILQKIDSGENIFVGPSCIKEYISKDYKVSSIPDFTKYTLTALDEKEGDGHNSKERIGNTIILTEQEKDYKKAVEYLELREQKLAKNFKTSYKALSEYYKIYLDKNKLETNTIQHILNIEKKAPEKLKLNNLQKCYNYSFWIKIGIQKLDYEASDFLKSIDKYLEENLKISEKQKQGVNNWLKNLKGIPHLK